jgi:hypothetical protein
MTSTKSATASKLSLLKGKKSREGTHAVVLDHEAVETYAQARMRLINAQGELRKARRLNEPAATMEELQAIVDEAQDEADQLEPAAEEGVVQVKLHAMPPLVYAALKAEHPATEADHQRVRKQLDDDKAKARWNEEEFAPRLAAHCLIDPAVSLEEAREFQAAWGRPDWNELIISCMNLHEQTVDTSSLVFSSGRTRN